MFGKYFGAPIKSMVTYLFLPLIFFIAFGITDVGYVYLSEIFPSVFPEYSQVLEKELYEALQTRLQVFSVLLSVFFIHLFCAVYDNFRYESVIKKTDGFYKIKDQLLPYLKSTAIQDALSCALSPLLLLSVSTVSFPEKFLKYFGSFFYPHILMLSNFGFLISYLMIIFAAVIARLIAAPLALDRFRGLWLTSFVDG